VKKKKKKKRRENKHLVELEPAALRDE